MKQRVQVTLNPDLIAEAKLLMQQQRFDSLSEFVEHLIRQEWKSAAVPKIVNSAPEHTPNTGHKSVVLPPEFEKLHQEATTKGVLQPPEDTPDPSSKTTPHRKGQARRSSKAK